MKTKWILLSSVLIGGCSFIEPMNGSPIDIGGGKQAHYVKYDVGNLTGRDVWVDGKLVHSSDGRSIAAGITDGVGASVAQGVGYGVPAALGAFQTHVNETTVATSDQAQGQAQKSTTKSTSGATSNSSGNSQNGNKNRNTNVLKSKVTP